MMEMMTTISTWMMRMVMMMKMITKNADFYDPPNKLQLQTLKLNSSNENSAPCQRQAWNRGQSPLIIQPRHGKTPCGAITNFPAGRPPGAWLNSMRLPSAPPHFVAFFILGNALPAEASPCRCVNAGRRPTGGAQPEV